MDLISSTHKGLPCYYRASAKDSAGVWELATAGFGEDAKAWPGGGLPTDAPILGYVAARFGGEWVPVVPKGYTP